MVAKDGIFVVIEIKNGSVKELKDLSRRKLQGHKLKIDIQTGGSKRGDLRNLGTIIYECPDVVDR